MKIYIKPEAEVMEMVAETPMLTASLEFRDDDDPVDTESEWGQLSTGRGNRRGKWGDLWYSGE